METLNLSLKREHPSWGGPKIREKLKRRFPHIKPPAISLRGPSPILTMRPAGIASVFANNGLQSTRLWLCLQRAAPGSRCNSSVGHFCCLIAERPGYPCGAARLLAFCTLLLCGLLLLHVRHGLRQFKNRRTGLAPLSSLPVDLQRLGHLLLQRCIAREVIRPFFWTVFAAEISGSGRPMPCVDANQILFRPTAPTVENACKTVERRRDPPRLIGKALNHERREASRLH